MVKIFNYEWYTQQELIGNNAIDIFVNEGGKGVLKAKIN
jgi:hypothetical protein